MFTISTLVNTGSSYLVRDIYQRFWRPQAQERELVRAARGASLLVLACGGVASWWVRDVSVDSAWKFLAALGAGTGLVNMARWLWWRINAWTEIAAVATSFIGYLARTHMSGPWSWSEEQLLAINAFVAIAGWLAVTWLTRPERPDVLVRFYRLVRPAGPGWRPMARMAPDVIPDRGLWRDIVAAFAGVGLVYSTLATIGCLLWARPHAAMLRLVATTLFALGIYRYGFARQTGDHTRSSSSTLPTLPTRSSNDA